MGINLSSNFTMNSGLPLDDRALQANLTARDAIPALQRYLGMTVYVESDTKFYSLVGGILNANWVESNGGGGGGGGATSTGLKEGSALSIGGPAGTFTVALGKAVHVDAITDVDNAAVTDFAVTAKVDVAVTNIAIQPVTYILVSSADALIQQAAFPTPAERRDNVFLGVVVHSDNVTVNAVNNIPSVAIDTNAQLQDFMIAIGLFNLSGNRITANGANLSFDKAAGNIFKAGVNFDVNPKDPHRKALGTQALATFRYRNQDSSEGSNITVLDPTTYDNAGVTTTVPSNNNATIQRIYIFPSGLIRVQRGQEVFANFGDAVVALGKEAFITESNIEENGLLLASVVLKKTATSLLTTADAGIFPASKFGELGSGGSSATVNLTQAYQNSIDPEFQLDVIRGMLSTADALVPLGTNLTEVTNFGGVIKYNEISAARNKITDANGTFIINESLSERQLENFKETDPTTLVSTANTTWVTEIVNQLDGFRSAKMTQTGASGADNGELKKFNVSNQEYHRGLISMLFDYNSNAPEGDFFVRIREFNGIATNTFSNVGVIENGDGQISFDLVLLSDTTELTILIDTAVPNNAHEIICDNVRLDLSGVEVTEIGLLQTLEFSDAGNNIQNATGEIRFSASLDNSDTVGDALIDIEDDSGNGRTKLTALVDCILHTSFGAKPVLVNRALAILKNDILVYSGTEIFSANRYAGVSGEVELKAGQFVTFSVAVNAAASAESILLDTDPYKLTFVAKGKTNSTAFSGTFIEVDDGVTAPSSAAGKARIYVDSADGDLKVIFGDGTVKTIVTDT